MSDQSSELIEISKLSGDFRKNYGKLVGAYLYLRSALFAAAPGFGLPLCARLFRSSLLG
jgi:hypothetical protein